MHHYVEQFHEINGMVSGRIDVSECRATLRKSITHRIKSESSPGYKTRLVKWVEPKQCFPPVLRHRAESVSAFSR
ncbi:hypothetical protein [Spirosoma terrae]|uniref:Uncharacterized protein n=1 Tax=Spirosoma terrae TaxID=1968276 RepID=A0A6L9L644_9BACT|nr:hypothetical protein [Spirosoma terrae]NDU94822.1 hypothetical protein [Spirosoma terrae]